MRKFLLHGVLGAMAIAACSDAAAPNGTVESVVVAPAGGSLLIGDTMRLVAAALDADGQTLLNQEIRWASSDPSVATVSGSGLVTAVAAGAVAIYAASGSQADSAILDVVAPLVATQIALGGSYSCALDNPGIAYCWGENYNGELGANVVSGRIRRATPVAGGLTWSRLFPGLHHTCGLTQGGAAYCWGWDYIGQLGDSGTAIQIAPTPVLGAPVSSVALGYNYSCGVISNGVRCWGSNWIAGFTGAPALQTLTSGQSHVCGLVSNGQAYCWGGNFYGEVGDSSLTQQLLPVPVFGGRFFTTLSSGSYTNCGLVAGGAAYCWGNNSSGQVGDGTLVDQTIPVAVANGLLFTAISVGYSHTCGVTTQGLAYCWGNNVSGQLGDGSGTDSAVPVAVAGGLRFARISAGASHTCGITVSGPVYCWGDNSNGALGDGTYVQRLAPVAVHAP